MVRHRETSTGGHRGRPDSHGVRGLSLVMATMAMLAVLLLVLWAIAGHETQGRSPAAATTVQARTASPSGPSSLPPASSPPRSPGPADRWRRVLETVDLRRAEAWRLGRPALLSSVYTSGSTVLAEDRQMLRGYLRRGLRVSGVTTTFLSVVVARAGPAAATLDVVDRLGPATVLGANGVGRLLPHDLPTRHRIDLVKAAGGWRIADVTLS